MAASTARKRDAEGELRTPRAASLGAGPIDTFLLQGLVDSATLESRCAPLLADGDCSGLVFFTLGVKPETVASAASSLGLPQACPVFVADSYGIIGWDEASGTNVELMEKGRGSEYGCVGGSGGEGVVVAAFRGAGHAFSVPDRSGGLPEAGLHMLVTSGEVPAPSKAGAIYGGVAKACFRLEEGGGLTKVQQFAVSSPSAVVSSFGGDAGEAARDVLGVIPNREGNLAAAGYFPCFCRGVNKYGRDGVEPAAFASAGLGATRLFGMFAHGEFGPPEGKPIVCAPESAPPMSVRKGSMISILALYH